MSTAEQEDSDSGFEEHTDPHIHRTHDSSLVSLPTCQALASPKMQREPAVPLIGFAHSLLPDMIFGWQPKLIQGGPIPLLYTKSTYPVSLHPITHLPNRVLYHGFRPHNSLILHLAFSTPETYPLPTYAAAAMQCRGKQAEWEVDMRPFVGNSPDPQPDDLEFDAFFEEGNLDMVVRAENDEYDLYMRSDANTRGHNQWFFFSASAPKSCEIRFNILNFTKPTSLYSQGMRPLVLDTTQEAQGWQPAGSFLRYRTSKLNPYADRCYYSLSFTYRFKHSQKVYFAYAIPYTYTRLRRLLTELSIGTDMRYKRDTLCRSLSGLDVPLLTITNFAIPVSSKEAIVVTARVHPGETYGSFMMEVGCM